MLRDEPSTYPSNAAPCISSEPAEIIAELFRQRHRRVTPSIPPNAAVARRAQGAIPRDIHVDKSSHKGAGGHAPSQRLTAVVLLDPRPRADLCDVVAERATISLETANVANRGCGRYHFETFRRAQTYSMMYQYCNFRQRSDLPCLASCVPVQHVPDDPVGARRGSIRLSIGVRSGYKLRRKRGSGFCRVRRPVGIRRLSLQSVATRNTKPQAPGSFSQGTGTACPVPNGRGTFTGQDRLAPRPWGFKARRFRALASLVLLHPHLNISTWASCRPGILRLTWRRQEVLPLIA
jgi:hypothetical protein